MAHICCSALILLGPISGGDVDESPPPSSDRPLPTIFLCDDIKGRDRRLHHSNAASDRPTTTTPLLQFTPVLCSHWTRPSTSPASGPQDVQPIIALPQIRRQGVCGVCVSSKSIIRHRSSTTGCLSPPANLPCLQSVVLYSDAACLLLSHRSHPQNSVLSVAASLDNKNITATSLHRQCCSSCAQVLKSGRPFRLLQRCCAIQLNFVTLHPRSHFKNPRSHPLAASP
jgi:hypothetical protein